jgi:hypothetical protein
MNNTKEQKASPPTPPKDGGAAEEAPTLSSNIRLVFSEHDGDVRAMPSETCAESEEAEEKAAVLEGVIGLWNDKLEPLGFPCVQKATSERARHFKARLGEDKQRHALAWWGELFDTMAQSAFLRDKAKNKAPWLTFDWILNETNVVKIVEGKYNGPDTLSNPRYANVYEMAASRSPDEILREAFGGESWGEEPCIEAEVLSRE